MLFLITYLHEVAHHLTFIEFGRDVKPHGSQWKNCFRHISKPVLNSDTFPNDVLLALNNYFINPKASSCADPFLYNILKRFDENRQPSLASIPHNSLFRFRGKQYKKMKKQRTRWICEEFESGKKYLIPGIAEVEILSKD